MKHARSDYDCVQDITGAKRLAEIVLTMTSYSPKMEEAHRLAKEILEGGVSSKFPADEPVFVIRSQDIAGAEAVRGYVDLARAAGADENILNVCLEHAAAMDAWPKKKVPDLPVTGS